MAKHQELGLLHAIAFPFFLTHTPHVGTYATVHTRYPISLPI